jgi:D-arabinose 5-phosphate isomerase GutQ
VSEEIEPNPSMRGQATAGLEMKSLPKMTHDDIWERALFVWEVAAKEISRLAASVDKERFAQCLEAFATCRGRIVTMGCGTSAVAARKVAHSLSCIERPAFFLSPCDAPHGALGAVQPGDVAVLFSKSGETDELLVLLPSLKAKKVLLVAATENEGSALARQSDLVLKVKVDREADSFNMLATTSTMAVVAVFDAICVALMEYTGYTREQFAVIHPRGAVGKRLIGSKE